MNQLQKLLKLSILNIRIILLDFSLSLRKQRYENEVWCIKNHELIGTTYYSMIVLNTQVVRVKEALIDSLLEIGKDKR